MGSVAVVATVEASNVPPRVRLDVTASGTPAITATTVTRLNPDGTTSPVRTFDGNPLQLTVSGSNYVGLLYDYEMPFGASVSYSTLETPGASSASVTVNSSQVWLIHPGVPALSLPVKFMPGTLLTESYGVQQGIFYPMGRTNPIVVSSGARNGERSSITLSIDTLADVAAVKALIQDAGIIYLNIPASMNTGHDSSYVAVQEVTVSRMTDVVIDGARTITMPFVVVDRPAGGSQSERNYVDLLDFSSYTALQQGYATYAAVLAGP